MKKEISVSIIMGSDSDLPIMKQAAEILDEFNIPYEIDIVSAHRTPDKMVQFAKKALQRKVKVIIAGAGGAAHLPGMVASLTVIPVIGVPINSSNSIEGLDSLLSIAQMPGGIPVATVAINGAKNAGILAAQIIAISDKKLQMKLTAYKNSLGEKVKKSAQKINKLGYKKFLSNK